MDYTESEKGEGKRMKTKRNKLVSVVAMALSMALMLGACGSQSTGARASKDMIPLSDIIFSDEDVLIYRAGRMGSDYTVSSISKDWRTTVYRFQPDGNYSEIFGVGLGELAQMSDEEILANDEWYEDGAYSWNIATDGSGNNTDYIHWVEETNKYAIGAFQGHITIYDSSYMVFSSISYYSSYYVSDSNAFILIRDTKDTMDKTVYLDTPGTEGFKVDGQ